LSASDEKDQPIDLATFRDRFEKLLEELEGLDAIVVFIDNLDMCLPDTIVDTFEAVRLFLNAPKTAFAVALNRRVVEDAVNRQYLNICGPHDTIGHDYFEKMLQLTVTVPPLSELDAETYLNLLLCESGLTSESFQTVREEAVRRRHSGDLNVTMNCGIAKELVDVPEDLQRMFMWVNATAARRMEVLDGTAEQVPEADASVDAAWAVNAMHHWTDLDAAIGEIWRVLRRGGRLLLVDEDFDDPAHEDHERLRSRRHDPEFAHIDPSEVGNRLAIGGFVVEEAGATILAGQPAKLVRATKT
jgi:SAM-dependent methyltransferase